MMHIAWSTVEEVYFGISRSFANFHRGQKIADFYPTWAFPDRNASFNSPMATKCCTNLHVGWERCPIVFEGHLFNFKVARDKKITDFEPNSAFPDCNSSCNSPMATKWCTRLEGAQKRCPILFQGHPSNLKSQGHTGQEISDFDLNWAFPDGNSSLNSQMALKWCTNFDVV